MTNLEDVRKYLRSAPRRPMQPLPEEVERFLVELKQQAIQCGDQGAAKNIWCIEQALKAQNLYIRAFQNLRDGQFYKAWRDYEQTELTLGFLEPHETTTWSDFHLHFIREYVAKWQALFPYKIFMSPEILKLEKVCSVCMKPVSPRNPCGHRVGEIYDGEMCCRVVKRAEVLAVAFVEKPAQKYSVPFFSDPETGEIRDHYNYEILKYAISALRSPFDNWEAIWTTKRQPHSKFCHIGRNNPCPCDSGKKYKKYCLREEGILRPHLEFRFDVAPLPDLPKEVYIP